MTDKLENLNFELNSKKILFKTKYKFIEFEKKKSDIKSNQNTQVEKCNESIQTFYRSLTSDNDDKTNAKVTENPTDHKAKIQFETVIDKKSNKTKNEFLKAAEQNNLQLIKSYLEDTPCEFSLNVCDDYKWNALMISVVAFRNDIVKYLLDNHAKHLEFKEFLYSKDLSGSDAENLAIKFKNKNALEMLRNAKLKLELTSLQLPINSKEDAENKLENSVLNQTENFNCEICKKDFFNQSRIEHFTSIVHQLNENEKDSSKNRKNFNYHLRASKNKGYQMLLKS